MFSNFSFRGVGSASAGALFWTPLRYAYTRAYLSAPTFINVSSPQSTRGHIKRISDLCGFAGVQTMSRKFYVALSRIRFSGATVLITLAAQPINSNKRIALTVPLCSGENVATRRRDNGSNRTSKRLARTTHKATSGR